MKWAVVINGVVVNVVRWDGKTDWTPPEGALMVNIDEVIAGIGWTYDNRTFTPPENPPTRR